MLTRDIPSQSLPYLRLSDKVFQALQLMNEHHVTHLPIIDGERFAGIISEDDLLQAENEKSEIRTLQQSFGNMSVKSNEHFLKAIQIAVENGLSVVPVVEQEELVGAVAYRDLLKQASVFMNLKEPGGLIVLEIENIQYSFNEISKIIEANDAHITQLNTTTDPETGLTQITIRVNKSEISDIIAAFQRHEYHVKYYFGDELYENELRINYDNLMNYLRI
jgi:acetoin utilization protein AcuB